MADTRPAKKAAPEAAKKASKAPAKKADKGFTADERAAMKERVKELKAARGDADAEAEVLAKIAEMPEAERVMAERLHALIKAHAPSLAAKTWYGMPAYTLNGETVCFFQSAQKFKSRYATLGFSDKAKLDDGDLFATAFALKALGASEEAKLIALIKKAVG